MAPTLSDLSRFRNRRAARLHAHGSWDPRAIGGTFDGASSRGSFADARLVVDTLAQEKPRTNPKSPPLRCRRGEATGGRPSTRGYAARATEETQSLASFLAPAYSSRQTRLRTTGSGMRARTRRSCTVISLLPIIFARDTFTFSSPFASAHLTFCTIASHRTRT